MSASLFVAKDSSDGSDLSTSQFPDPQIPPAITAPAISTAIPAPTSFLGLNRGDVSLNVFFMTMSDDADDELCKRLYSLFFQRNKKNEAFYSKRVLRCATTSSFIRHEHQQKGAKKVQNKVRMDRNGDNR